MDLQLSSHRQHGWSVAHVEGELDIATAGQLRDRIARDLVRHGRRARVIMDLSALDFCDASGLGALVNTYRTAQLHGGQLRLAIPPGRVLRVLQLTGLDHVLPVFPTVRDAVAGTNAVATALGHVQTA